MLFLKIQLLVDLNIFWMHGRWFLVFTSPKAWRNNQPKDHNFYSVLASSSSIHLVTTSNNIQPCQLYHHHLILRSCFLPSTSLSAWILMMIWWMTLFLKIQPLVDLNIFWMHGRWFLVFTSPKAWHNNQPKKHNFHSVPASSSLIHLVTTSNNIQPCQLYHHHLILWSCFLPSTSLSAWILMMIWWMMLFLKIQLLVDLNFFLNAWLVVFGIYIPKSMTQQSAKGS